MTTEQILCEVRAARAFLDGAAQNLNVARQTLVMRENTLEGRCCCGNPAIPDDPDQQCERCSALAGQAADWQEGRA